MNTTESKDICSIKVIFPVETDEKANEIRQKIKAMLNDNPYAQIQFSLITGRPPAPSG